MAKYIVSSGEVSSGIILAPGDSMTVLKSGTANSTTMSGGIMYVSSGGIANCTMLDGGYFDVSSGGTANSTTVNSNGRLNVSAGGIAMEIKENGGYVYIGGGTATFAPNTFTGKTVSYGATVHSGTTANSTIVLSEGGLSVFNGGNANNTTVDSWGSLYISKGGTATDTTVNIGQMFISSGGYASKVLLLGQDDRAEGDIYVTKGGVVKSVTVSDYGDYYVLSEGTAIKTIVNSTGNMEISSGGTAMEITENGGFVKVEEGAQVAFASNSFSGLVLSGWQSINKGERTQDSASIHSGTTAFNTDVQSDGILFVFFGGSISNTSVCSNGVVTVSSGGTADSTKLNRKGVMNVSCGGIANGITVDPGGALSVKSSGTATEIIENGGYVSFQKGANVAFISNTFSGLILHDSASVHSGTVANNTSITYGQLSVFSDGIVNSTTVSGSMIVYDGGKGNSTTVYGSGECTVSSGGIADDVKVYAVGTLRITNGGIVTGKMSFLAGAVVSVEKGAIIDFDLNRTTENGKSLLNDWSLIQGTPDYTITVKDNQKTGIYKLADAAAEFDGTITVKNTTGKSLGTLKVGESLEVGEDTYTLRIDDETLVLSIEGFIPDTTPPTVSNIQASITTMTNQDVIVTAQFDDNEELSSAQYRIGDSGKWVLYTNGVTVKENGTVYFKAIDAAGNESEIVSYTVSNIDKVAPSDPAGLDTVVSGQKVALVWDVSTDDSSGVKEYVVTYTLDGQEFTIRTGGTSYVLNNADFGDYSWTVQAVDAAGNESEISVGEAFTVSNFEPYIVEYSTDSFEHVLRLTVSTAALDSFRLPTGTYEWRIRSESVSDWQTGAPIVSVVEHAPEFVQSDGDGNDDLFFANPCGTWEAGYFAQHVGSINDWDGTKEYAALSGKNKLADIFEGSDDANILLLTDDANGDALFVDDIYTALPGTIEEQQARIARINEIRAGAGDDIIDMTSQRFEYVGDGQTLCGGDGNDTIWANKGANWLFGDAGDDRITGASGNDVIAGGIGDDRMHGGGGNDVFTFCENWGTDTVKQLAGGSVTLWFESGSIDNWDEETLTYSDGDNSVTVSGVSTEQIELKFGAGTTPDDADQFASLSNMGAFEAFTTRKIFEEATLA